MVRGFLLDRGLGCTLCLSPIEEWPDPEEILEVEVPSGARVSGRLTPNFFRDPGHRMSIFLQPEGLPIWRSHQAPIDTTGAFERGRLRAGRYRVRLQGLHPPLAEIEFADGRHERLELDVSGLGEVLGELALRAAARDAVGVEQQRPARRRALIEGEDEHAGVVDLPAGGGVMPRIVTQPGVGRIVALGRARGVAAGKAGIG